MLFSTRAAISSNFRKDWRGLGLPCDAGMLESDFYRLEVIVLEIGSALSLFLLVAQRAIKEFERTLLLFLRTWNSIRRALSGKSS